MRVDELCELLKDLPEDGEMLVMDHKGYSYEAAEIVQVCDLESDVYDDMAPLLFALVAGKEVT